MNHMIIMYGPLDSWALANNSVRKAPVVQLGFLLLLLLCCRLKRYSLIKRGSAIYSHSGSWWPLLELRVLTDALVLARAQNSSDMNNINYLHELNKLSYCAFCFLSI